MVLLITDGLDREAGKGLGAEMERLHKSCRRLIWLNPLLRYDGFAPKSMGVRALLPHVDEFRPVHSLDSLEDLAKLLGKPAGIRRSGMTDWLGKLAEIKGGDGIGSPSPAFGFGIADPLTRRKSAMNRYDPAQQDDILGRTRMASRRTPHRGSNGYQNLGQFPAPGG